MEKTLTTTDFVALEEKMNNLMKDKDIKKVRTACSDFVMGKLKIRVDNKLEKLGINKELQNAFVENDEEAFKKILEILKNKREETGLSNQSMKQFIIQATMDKSKALEVLKEMLLKKERIAFGEEVGLTAKVLLDFIHARNYTSEDTIETIAEGLNLEEEEKKEMKALNLPRFFYLSSEFCEEIHKIRKSTGMGVEEFLVYAFISKDAWRKFNKKSDEESDKNLRTSQGTLLKLIVGFGFEEERAKEFLNKVGSGFVMTCDLAFQTAITVGYRILERKDPTDVVEIVEFLSSGGDSYDKFYSPYKE